MRVQAFKMLPRNAQDALLNKYPEIGDIIIRKHLPFFQRAPMQGITIDDILLGDIKNRIALQLLVVNLGIVMTGAVLSYFLAGRTLAPLEDAIEEQKRFVSDASHELRTPLTSLKTEIEVALRDKKMTLHEAKKLLNSNLEEVDKMQMLSNYLLALNKYESGNLTIPFTKINIKEILTQNIKKFSTQIAEKKIIVETDLHDIFIKANEISVSELFSIVIDNAIKYSHAKSIIKVKNYARGKHAVIEVQDYGIGIDAKDIPHIFDRFYRSDNSRCKTTCDGYGLGLAIAKSIVNLHSGTIDVVSSTKGSTFIIKL
jgi:signal transduction histidine kinase